MIPGGKETKGLWQVARQSVLYGLGNLGTSLVSLLLIPVFTRRLSPAEYGILNLAETAIALATLVLSLGLEASLMRYYFLYPSEEERKQAISSIALTGLIPMLLVSAPVFFSRDLCSRVLFHREGFSPLILLAYGVALGTILCQFGLGYVRCREQALRYSWLNVSRLLLYALLGCAAVMILSQKVRGVLLASLIAQSLIGVVTFVWMLRQVRVKVVWAKVLRALRYSLPLVPSGLALWVVAVSDRYFLSRYNGLAAVGVYSLGYQLGTAPMFVFSAFQLAWPQFAFRIAEDLEAGRTYARLTRYVTLGGGMAFLILSLFAREWVSLLAGRAYQKAYEVIPLVALAHLGFTAYFLFATGITIKEKTGWLPLITGISGVVNLIGNFLLIPRYGPMGAALATLVGYTVLAVLTYAFSNRYLPVPYEFSRIGRIVGLILGIWLFSLLLTSLPHYILSLGGRIILCLAYPLLAILVGGATNKEFYKLKSLLTSFVRLRRMQ